MWSHTEQRRHDDVIPRDVFRSQRHFHDTYVRHNRPVILTNALASANWWFAAPPPPPTEPDVAVFAAPAPTCDNDYNDATTDEPTSATNTSSSKLLPHLQTHLGMDFELHNVFVSRRGDTRFKYFDDTMTANNDSNNNGIGDGVENVVVAKPPLLERERMTLREFVARSTATSTATAHDAEDNDNDDISNRQGDEKLYIYGERLPSQLSCELFPSLAVMTTATLPSAVAAGANAAAAAASVGITDKPPADAATKLSKAATDTGVDDDDAGTTGTDNDVAVHVTSRLLWFTLTGSCAPLHYDLSEGVLAQVEGAKHVLLIAPHERQQETLYPHPVSSAHDRQSRINDIHAVDVTRFPHAVAAAENSSSTCTTATDTTMETMSTSSLPASTIPLPLTLPTAMQGTVAAGELLYIPYGWWHQIESRGVSASVTQRWHPYADALRAATMARRAVLQQQRRCRHCDGGEGDGDDGGGGGQAASSCCTHTRAQRHAANAVFADVLAMSAPTMPPALRTVHQWRVAGDDDDNGNGGEGDDVEANGDGSGDGNDDSDADLDGID